MAAWKLFHLYPRVSLLLKKYNKYFSNLSVFQYHQMRFAPLNAATLALRYNISEYLTVRHVHFHLLANQKVVENLQFIAHWIIFPQG